MEARDEFSNIEIWSRKSKNTRGGYYNVATGASITGAARAVLLEALATSEGLVYCDTDSITCRSAAAIRKSAELGAWKLEAQGHTMAVAGKKLYCLLGDTPAPPPGERDRIEYERELPHRIVPGAGYALKMASKGVQLDASEIYRVAKGETVHYRNAAPSMRFFSDQRFIERNVRMT